MVIGDQGHSSSHGQVNEYSTNAARPTFMNYYCVKLIDTIYFDMALIDVIIGRAAPESIEVL